MKKKNNMEEKDYLEEFKEQQDRQYTPWKYISEGRPVPFDEARGNAALLGIAMGVIADKLIEQLAKEVSGAAMKEAVGLIPVVGDIVFAGVDIAADIAENEQNIEDSQSVMSVLRAAEIAVRFDLNANFIYSGEAAETVVIVSPGVDTPAILEKFNAYIEESGMDLSVYDATFPEGESLTHPITIDDLLNHGADVLAAIGGIKGETPEDTTAIKRSIFGDTAGG